jgi:hypothetical protein
MLLLTSLTSEPRVSWGAETFLSGPELDPTRAGPGKSTTSHEPRDGVHHDLAHIRFELERRLASVLMTPAGWFER